MKNNKIFTLLAIIAGVSTLAIISIVHAANLSTNLARCTTNSGAINISYTECQSLAYLYEETNGDNWTAKSGWFTNTNVSTWKGGDGTNTGNAMYITGGHVITLSLRENNLQGNIISGVVGLSYLSGLDLFRNGVLNINTSGMSALRSINLGMNTAFTGDFTYTTGLKYLNVYFNNMYSERLSTLIAPLRDLEHLFAWNNILSGGLDVSTLTKLRILELNESSLSSIDLSNNTGLTVLTIDYNTLTYLDLSHNPLLSYATVEYGLLTGVKLGNPVATEMYFGSNNISSINLSGATGLQSIRVSDNQLTSVDVSHNTQLQGLDLARNNITYLTLNGASSLTNVRMEGNFLTGIALSGAPALDFLDISSQQGSGITTLDISNNTNLGQLHASGNSIDTLITAPAGSYSALTVFDLSDNPLSNVTDSNALSLLGSNPQYTSVGNFTGTAHDTAITLDWSKPVDYGYSGDLYKYTVTLNSGSAINISGLFTTTYVITGLTNSQSYFVSLCAIYSTTGADQSLCEYTSLTPMLSVCQPGRTLYTGGLFPDCIPCEAGTFNSDFDGVCQPAPVGYYIDTAGAIEATQCEIGSYSNSTGSITCTWADSGSFVAYRGSTGSTLCIPGTYNSTTGSMTCLRADQGYYVSGYGASFQTPCEANTYTDVQNSTSCLPCPTGYTSNAGARVCTQIASVGGGGGLTSFTRNPLTTVPTSIVTIPIPQRTEIKPSDSQTDTDPGVDEAYTFGFTYGLTTLEKEKARLYEGLNRFELAKMVSTFLENVLKKETVENPLCDVSSFADSATFDSEMQKYIKKACDYGLMGWKGDKKSILDSFNPFGSVTREQFAIALYRALFNGDASPSSAQLQALNQAGIIKNISTPEMSELRGYTLLMFQRAAEYYKK